MDKDVEEVYECDPFQGISPYPFEEQYEGETTKKENQPNKSKTVDLKLECHDCGSIFKSKCKLRVHWRQVHLQQQLICPHCKQMLKTYKAFHNHMKRKTKNCLNAAKVRVEGVGKSRIFYCKECNNSSKKIQTIVNHLLIHTGERPYICNICNRGFIQQSSLQAHREYAHKQFVKEVTCEQCGKLFKGRHSWSKHMRSHRNEKFPCSICNKLYSSKDILKEHMKRHSGIKPYRCEICMKSFYISSDLRNHKVKVHFKTQIYSCMQCEYKSCSCGLTSSLRLEHTGNNLVCENEQQLNLHQNRHFERNTQCSYCNKTFHGKKNLASHIKSKHDLHTSIKIKDEK